MSEILMADDRIDCQLTPLDAREFLVDLPTNELTQKVLNSQRIIIPSEDRVQKPVIAWLRQVADLDVPEFTTKRPSERSGGREFILRRSTDVARSLESDAFNRNKDGEPLNAVGFAGSDKYLDYTLGSAATRVAACPIAEPDCRFVLAGPASQTEEIRSALLAGSYFTVGSSLRNILEYYQKLNGLMFSEIVERAGKVEGLIETNEADLVADITQTGDSLRDCGLDVVAEIVGFQLCLMGVADSLE